MALAHHADTIRLLAKDRRSLRLQRAKKDTTIARLREKIHTLEMAPLNRNQDAMMQLLQTLLADREDERAERQANIAALQQIANQGHGNHDHPGSKLKNFQNTNPPVFSKTEEPLDADDWLQTMENNLEVAGVDENEKVLFATHYLAGPARAWWTSARALNAGQMMTWADFKLKFSKYHVPPGLIKKMRDEFRELKQGRMSVVEYRDGFLTCQGWPSSPATPLHQLSSSAVSTGKKFAPNNPNNRGGRLYHMNTEEAQEAPDVVLAEEKVHKIREYLKTAQSRQKSYADKRRREMTFEIGDFVYLKVSPLKGMQRFQLKGKLAPRYVGPFKVLSRQGEVSHQLELPEEMAAVHNVFHISLLQKCLKVPEKTEVFKNIDHRSVDINSDLTYREVPIRIWKKHTEPPAPGVSSS
ncbi:hypothetical protein QYE76_035066 [Lolium multiflorum]|uniref:Retrotransposon gag domain-containing protein n=1 Tax=Lolium multiflorum TaxID=4521 RepID=A0AAD8QYI3_LOLMU|nr:hypothetical protein QYE76_035066 [Lolium multiflorum]